MDVERLIVSRVAQTQTLQSLVSRNIETHHFLQRPKGDSNPIPLPGEVYQWMCEHYRRYKAAPSHELTRSRWPSFEFLDTSDPLDVLVDEMVKVVKRRALIEKIRELSEVADDPSKWSEAEVYVFEAAADLARTLPTSTITKLSESFNRLDAHRIMQESGRAPGITLVGPDLDHLTYGIQPGELMIWQGFLGTGKSTCSMIQAGEEYLHNNKTTLAFSLEMDGQKMANHWDAAMAGFQYKALKFMEMRDDDYERWARFAEKAFECRAEKDILIIDDIARCTPERIFAEVERWSPDMFIVDTIDEIAAPAYIKSHWERGDYAARELKAVCRVTKKPGIGVAQAGREAEEDGATLGNMAQSITIARKADLVVGIHATPQMKRSNMIVLRMLKNRDGEGNGIEYTYYRDPATLVLRPWAPSDAIAQPPSAQAGTGAGQGTNAFAQPS